MSLPTYNVETGWSYQYTVHAGLCDLMVHSCLCYSTLALWRLRSLNFGMKPFMLGTLDITGSEHNLEMVFTNNEISA